MANAARGGGREQVPRLVIEIPPRRAERHSTRNCRNDLGRDRKKNLLTKIPGFCCQQIKTSFGRKSTQSVTVITRSKSHLAPRT
jgi:hypothetical protein